VPWKGSDAAVVRASQKQLVQLRAEDPRHAPDTHPFQFGIYCGFNSLGAGLKHLTWNMIFLACIQSKCGVNALLKYPGPLTLGTFSHEGPSERVLRTAWVELRFFGSGYSVAGARAEGAAPDRQVEAFFRLPEAGYVATPIFVVTAAERILAGDTAVKAGVVTTATAFRGTGMLDRLREQGIEVGVRSEGPRPAAAAAGGKGAAASSSSTERSNLLPKAERGGNTKVDADKNA